MATAEIRTLVVDDHPDIRSLWRAVLELSADFVICGEAANGVEAVEQALAIQPDLVLLDVLMPTMDGATALPLIKQAAPAAKIVLATVLDSWVVEPSAEQSADGFVSKAQLVARRDDLLEDLRAVVRRR